jgi:DNA-binding NarL/FixJ family response regulator
MRNPRGDSKLKLNILLADDHTIVRQSLSRFLQTQSGYEVVGEAHDGLEAVKLAKELQPDIVIMDISMPNLNGIEATRQICSDHSKTRVIGLSMHTSKRCVVEMFKAGARGYLPKDCDFDELIEAISLIMAGRMYLSPLILKDSPNIEQFLEAPQ